MKKMNQNHRGEVCGVRPARCHTERKVSNKGEAYWALKRGERRMVAGGSLVELERRLKAEG